LVDIAHALALHRVAVADDMGIADNAVFVVLAAVDQPKQHDVAQQWREVTGTDVAAGRIAARTLEVAPIVDALPNDRTLDRLELNDARGALWNALGKGYDTG